jgi:hypothetical protein
MGEDFQTRSNRCSKSPHCSISRHVQLETPTALSWPASSSVALQAHCIQSHLSFSDWYTELNCFHPHGSAVRCYADLVACNVKLHVIRELEIIQFSQMKDGMPNRRQVYALGGHYAV